MKFACPKCNEDGVSLSTYLFDDFKKENRCTACDAKLLRRHYFSSIVFQMLFGGGLLAYIGIFLSWATHGMKGFVLSVVAAFSVAIVSRLVELPFTKMEDEDSPATKRRNKRNDKIFMVFLWIFIVVAGYGIYLVNTE